MNALTRGPVRDPVPTCPGLHPQPDSVEAPGTGEGARKGGDRASPADSARCTARCPAHERSAAGAGPGRGRGGAGPREGRGRACPEEDGAPTLWGVVCSASLTFANPCARRGHGPRLPPPRGERRVAIGWPRRRPVAIGFFRRAGGGPARWRESGGGGAGPHAAASGGRPAATGPGRVAVAGMDAAEVEFLAEKELVTVIPNFSLDKIYLIGVRAGPAVCLRPPRAGRRSWGAGRPRTPARPLTRRPLTRGSP